MLADEWRLIWFINNYTITCFEGVERFDNMPE